MEKRFSLAFSLAEALITLLVVAIITLATIPVITKKHRDKTNQKHGMYACYWNGNNLVAKQVVNGEKTNGTTQFDAKENRYGCVFNPPPGTKNFVVTVVGGGGGGAGSGARSSVRSSYTEPGDFTFTTPEAGIYQFLAVGAGGGGGDEWKSNDNQRACTGSTGGLVYVPGTVLGKDVKLNITVGRGGTVGYAASNSLTTGGTGGDTVIKEQSSNKNYATATGGGGGCSYYFFNSGPQYMKKKKRHFSGWNYSGSVRQIGYLYQGNGGSLEDQQWINIAGSMYAAPAGRGSSDFYNARIYYGKRLSALSTTDHQNKSEYYNLMPRLSDYNDIFGYTFNSVTKKPYSSGMHPCNRFPWQQRAQCKVYSDIYGAGGGGDGDYVTSSSSWSTPAHEGKGGFAGIAYRPVYAGLGGSAGKVIQVPYAEMPSKTLLFPGKGGSGGTAAPQIKRRPATNRFYDNEQTQGKDGQSSFIKNGSEILGGSGAKMIDPRDDETYSQEQNSNMMPMGGNGKMSDILTNKKVGNGGLGGLNKGEVTNNSIHGLTQTVFRNGSDISSFKYIYGAGSGGGGGSVSTSGTVLNFGNGGNGSSGLVFIQW